jgi:hypothetical protein
MGIRVQVENTRKGFVLVNCKVTKRNERPV